MASITLYNGMSASVDDEDVSFLRRFTWHALRACQNRENWYAYTAIGGRRMYMHRLLMPLGASQIDHIDGNGLNNCRSNLRYCNQRLNNANIKGTKSEVGFRGVELRQYKKTWRYRAVVWRNQKRVTVGIFSNPIDAAKARDRAAKDAYGEFARLNFPDDDFTIFGGAA